MKCQVMAYSAECEGPGFQNWYFVVTFLKSKSNTVRKTEVSLGDLRFEAVATLLPYLVGGP
jgi:hypothetical protein